MFKPILKKTLLFLLIINYFNHMTVVVHAGGDDKYVKENTRNGGQPNTNFDPKSWMDKLGYKTINSISIPGTHDSGSDLRIPWVLTQGMSIPSQLNAGIRYLDIRCRHVNDRFAIHHGEVYLEKNFDDVLLAVTQFLTQNPSETILMRVKQEHTPSGNSRSFEATFKLYWTRYASFFWTYNGNNNPKLSLIRRKIVVLQEFAGNLYGLDYASFNIQDEYKVNVIDTKKTDILDWFKKAGNTRRIISHLSGVGIFTPRGVADYTNRYMKDLIVSNNPAYVGIIPADFPSTDLIAAVIRANY